MNKKRNLLIFFVLAALVLIALSIGDRNVTTVNPNTDKSLVGDEGITYAALYNDEAFFGAFDKNLDAYNLAKQDVLLFGKTTLDYPPKKPLTGFTFTNEKLSEAGSMAFNGYYYGSKDKIKITVKSHGKGVYTLSITNTVNGTNIDDYLKLNGRKNEFLMRLPLEEVFYSVRYLNTDNEIVVTFYDGYRAADVDNVEKLLRSGLGDNFKDAVVFTINRKGVFSLEDVRLNIINPFPEP